MNREKNRDINFFFCIHQNIEREIKESFSLIMQYKKVKKRFRKKVEICIQCITQG